MIATLFELYHRGAVEASLPAFLLGDLNKSFRILVLWTIFPGVPLAVTLTAHFDSAATTFTVFLASTWIGVYMRWFYPFTAAFGRAIYAVFGCVFLILFVPLHLEFCIEQTIHMLQWYMILRAASRRHVLRICDRHCENSLQAIMAHVMSAIQLCGLGGRYIIRETCKALDSA